MLLLPTPARPEGITANISTAPGQTDAVDPSAFPDDLSRLVGKKVVVGRIPLCVPKTYDVNLSFAGKPATVVSFKPNAMLARFSSNANRLPPGVRASIEDARRGGILTFRFEDGTVLDSCADMMLSQLGPNMSLAAGETLAQPKVTSGAATLVTPGTTAGAQRCSLVITALSSGLSFGHAIIDSLTTSEFERQIDSARNGGVQKNYLDLRVRNDGEKPIKAFEFSDVYRNTMGDETISATYVSQNTQPIGPGATSRSYTMDRVERARSGEGDIKVYISRIRFGDDSIWEDNGTHSCFRTVTSK